MTNAVKMFPAVQLLSYTCSSNMVCCLKRDCMFSAGHGIFCPEVHALTKFWMASFCWSSHQPDFYFIIMNCEKKPIKIFLIFWFHSFRLLLFKCKELLKSPNKGIWIREVIHSWILICSHQNTWCLSPQSSHPSFLKSLLKWGGSAIFVLLNISMHGYCLLGSLWFADIQWRSRGRLGLALGEICLWDRVVWPWPHRCTVVQGVLARNQALPK